MKVKEILNEGKKSTEGRKDKTVEKLMWMIDGSLYANDIDLVKQRLVQFGTEPTLDNVKYHLINHLLLPIDLLKEPERAIILRVKSIEGD
jgi:hypothetical protein